MTAIGLWWRMLRRQDAQRLTLGLTLIAFATSTGVLLTVLGGLQAFLRRGGNPTYPLLAETATVILLIPIITLGGAAARLSVTRRDERLAALRLAGMTGGQAVLLAVADAAAQALLGSLLGAVLYLAAIPGVALLHFQGRTFGWSELWVGLPLLLSALAAVIMLAVVSATLSLAGVVIGPLGVARRVTPQRLSKARLIVGALVLAGWIPLFRSISSVRAMTALLVGLGVCFAVLNLIGPFVLGLVGRISASRATTATRLLAARRLADDPRSAWRTVAGVSLATFVAGVLSIVPSITGAADASSNPADAPLGTDLMTGSILTLVIAAILAAVSSGVTQASRLLDQREQYALLHLAGADLRVLGAARLRETWLPLAASVGIAAAAALIMVAPIGLPLIINDPRGVLIFGAGIGAALALVMAPVAASQPLVARVSRARSRARDETVVVRPG